MKIGVVGSIVVQYFKKAYILLIIVLIIFIYGK